MEMFEYILPAFFGAMVALLIHQTFQKYLEFNGTIGRHGEQSKGPYKTLQCRATKHGNGLPGFLADENDEDHCEGIDRSPPHAFETGNACSIYFGRSVGRKISIHKGGPKLTEINIQMQTYAQEVLQLMNSSEFADGYHSYSGRVVLSICQWKKTQPQNTS